MPFRNRIRGWKYKAKLKLGLGSANASTSSLPNMGQASPRPLPQAMSQLATPSADALVPSQGAQAPVHALSPADAITSTQAIEAPADASPSIVPDVQPSLSATPPPLSHNIETPRPHKSGEGRAKSTAWAGLKTLFKVLESSADAFGPLKSAIGGLNQCIDIYERAAKGREDYNELRSRLDSLLEDLNPFLGGQIPPAMTTSIENLCSGIEQELELVKDKQDRGLGRRYAEAMGDPEQVLECYRRICSHLERLTLNADLNTWKIVYEHSTGDRLDRLSPSHAAVYDSFKSSGVQRGPCTLGTRKEALTKLLGWARNDSNSDIYWMNGMAGTGKTTIAYSLCKELERTGELGASFFCSRSIPECRKVELILPSIAYQLARYSRPFRSALARVLESEPDVHQRGLDKQFNHLISKPLLETKNSMPPAVVVVIDALDECENEDTVGQILQVLLVDGRASKLPIRFLVSSRPESEIYPRMMKQVGNDLSARLVLHELATTTVKADISTYLRSELEDVLQPEQIAALVERSGVLFIYASTAARYIKDGLEFAEHEERLKMILGLLKHPANDGGRDIDTLYTSILKAAFEDKRLNESVRTRMKTVLHTVICAQEPLSQRGLAGLLGLTSVQQISALLRRFRSVVNIAEKDGLVTVLHASFPDFIFDEERSSTFYCDVEEHHGRLAEACLRVIGRNDPQFNLCQFQSSYLRDDQVVDLDERAHEAVSSELFYACRYWVAHLELGDKHSDLGELLFEFLSARLLLWMEVLNVKRSMHRGARIIQRAENYSRSNGYPEEISELAHDAWRFVTMFAGHSVSQSTPHIYTSMLPFWSGSAPISRHFKGRMRGPIQARGTAMTRRQLALLATWSFKDYVKSACFSPDGSLIAFAAMSSVYLIDGTTGSPVLGPLNHDDAVKCVVFSPDGSLISSGSEDNTIRMWNSQNGQLVGDPLKGHEGGVSSVRFFPHGTRIASSSKDHTIRVWDLQSGQTIVGPLQYSIFEWASLCLSSDGTRIACGNNNDGTVRVWDARSGEILFEGLEGHTNLVLSVCFSPDGTHMVSGSADNTIRVWSSQDGQLIGGPLEGHSSYIRSIAFSPDGNQIASGSSDNTIRLWDLNSNPISARTLEGHTGSVTSVAFSSDGARIVSCSDDKTIRVWDARTRATVADSLEGHTGPVYSAGFSPDGKHIVSGSADKTIRMWDAQSGQMVGDPLEGHTELVISVCFSPDGTRIASGSGDATIRVWDVQRGQTVIGPLEGHGSLVRAICLSPDGALIASGSYDKTIWVWDAQNGKPIGNPLKGHDNYVRSVCFSPDGTRIASGSDDQTILVWDFRSGQTVVEPLKGHTGIIRSVCFSPNGTCIASGCSDKTARVWDVQSGQPIFDPLEGHTDGISSVCFSPDGTLIVSGSFDKTIRLWDARSGRAIGDPLVGHTGPVYSVAFSPDGMHIVSGSADQTIRVWDVCGLLRMYGVTDYLPSPEPAPISPPRSHESWVLREDGWAVDPEGHLLVWVPLDLHLRLIRPCDTSIISPKGSFKLDFSSANLGESWAGCYQGPSC